MAIISCFSQPESLRGVLVCLNDTGGITGLCAVALALGIWIVAQVRSEAADKKRLSKVMKYGKPAISSPPTFGGQQHAETVHLFANRDYYQFLLSEFEKALFAQGYELTADRTRHVVPDSDSTRQVARAIMIARERYMAPLQSDATLEEKADECARAGYSHQWFCLLAAGSERTGWYITRRHEDEAKELTDWQKCMWPVRQVVIVVTADMSVITRDLVRGINEAVERVSNTPFPENDNTISLCTVPVTCPGLQVTLERQLCRTPPGFFPECAGRNVPEELSTRITVPLDGEKRVVSVFAQITSPHSTEMLSRYLNVATKRISAGEEHAADYNDDNGYAFIVTRTLKSH